MSVMALARISITLPRDVLAAASARPLPQLADRGGAADISGDAGRLRKCWRTGVRHARVRRAGGRGRPPAAPRGGSQTLSGGAAPTSRAADPSRPPGQAAEGPAAAGDRLRLL